MHGEAACNVFSMEAAWDILRGRVTVTFPNFEHICLEAWVDHRPDREHNNWNWFHLQSIKSIQEPLNREEARLCRDWQSGWGFPRCAREEVGLSYETDTGQRQESQVSPKAQDRSLAPRAATSLTQRINNPETKFLCWNCPELRFPCYSSHSVKSLDRKCKLISTSPPA